MYVYSLSICIYIFLLNPLIFPRETCVLFHRLYLITVPQAMVEGNRCNQPMEIWAIIVFPAAQQDVEDIKVEEAEDLTSRRYHTARQALTTEADTIREAAA